jgi:ADP-heptose:LPS heptosyltransferase
MEDCLTSLHLRSPYAVLNPGAGWKSKLWPPGYFGQVARLLGEERQVPSLVVWAGEQELAWAKEIVATSDGHARLAPATSLVELAAVIRRAQLFLGSDTGPMHLAAALGTRCVALYGPTRAEECGPHGRQHVALQVYYHSGTCRERRNAENDAMAAITPQMAFEGCERALDTAGERGTVKAA